MSEFQMEYSKKQMDNSELQIKLSEFQMKIFELHLLETIPPFPFIVLTLSDVKWWFHVLLMLINRFKIWMVMV